ncbi:MAG: hypothetical protein CM15mP51_13730 [Porticoccaceae bacterium]|nr:MAG: hypothetical protein CM15mP51_13730 [Porticoccaceae bacterium]
MGKYLQQAMRAAQNTVDKTRQVHSQHGYFIRPGDPKLPIIYEVNRVRDGRSFSTRSVNAKQEEKLFLVVYYHSKTRKWTKLSN